MKTMKFNHYAVVSSAVLFLNLANAYGSLQFKQFMTTSDKEFKPAAIAMGSQDKVYALDSRQAKVYCFDREGKLTGSWGERGSGPGQMKQPGGISVSPEGLIYISDTGNNRILAFTANGSLKYSFGAKGDKAGEMQDPEGIFVSHDNLIFVADTGNSRILVFSKDGIFINQWGELGLEPGRLASPELLTVDRNGTVYVADRKTKRIERFTASGKWMGTLSGERSVPSSSGITADNRGFTYVTDSKHNKVWEISPSGEHNGFLGAKGKGKGEFNGIYGIILTDNGNLIVGDKGNGRLQEFTFSEAKKATTKSQQPSPLSTLYVTYQGNLDIKVDNLAVPSTNFWYGINSEENKLVQHDWDGKQLWQVPPSGKNAGILSNPTGITALENGDAFVSESGNHRISWWKIDGTFGGTIGAGAKKETKLGSPQGLALNSNDTLFVADKKMKRMAQYSRDGIFLSSLKLNNEDIATELAISSGNLYAITAKNKVVSFDSSGRVLSVISERLQKPVDMAVSKDNEIIILDAGTNQVLCFDSSYHYRWSFGKEGKELDRHPGEFFEPHALALGPDNTIWVADTERVQIFQYRSLPSPPEGFTAKANVGEIELSWRHQGIAKSYQIFRATSPVENPYLFRKVETPPFVDKDIFGGLTYYYTLTAAGSSPTDVSPTVKSNPVLGIAPANQPPLEIVNIQIEPIFSAMYKYYLNHNLGRVVLRNNTGQAYTQVKIGFTLKEFMDFPTEIVVNEWQSYQTLEKPLQAVLNNKILQVTEDTPIQAELKLTFFKEGESHTVEKSQPFTIYSRNALVWDPSEKVATFVTPKDPPILNYARAAILPYLDTIDTSAIPANIFTGRVIFESLATLGVRYAADPNNPNLSLKDNPGMVDYVQFPRETLSRKTGDCDDLAILYAALLEAQGIATLLVDAPGHILLMFHSKESDTEAIGFPEDLIVWHSGAAWIPVEVTRVGSSFGEAWKDGASTVQQWLNEDKCTIIPLSKAWETYAPATLPETELNLAAPSKDTLENAFGNDWKDLITERFNNLSALWDERLKANPHDTEAMLQFGILFADNEKLDEAGQWFKQALVENPKEASALNNLGNIAFIGGDLKSAKEYYDKAAAASPADPGILLNLAMTASTSGKKSEATAYLKKAYELDPSLKERFPESNWLGSKTQSPKAGKSKGRK